MEQVTIISADCHGGASIPAYREYLEARWHDAFDEWRKGYDNPYKDLQSGVKNRNYQNERRISEQYKDGVVAEIVFPNTVPPFFPTGQHIAAPPSERRFQQRLAGLRAHNRWLEDFCAALPGQRAGLPQILVNDVAEAVADVQWAAEHGFRSVLIPHLPPDSPLPAFFSDVYDPLWAACQDLGIVLTQHGGSGVPSYGGSPATPLLMLMEVSFYAQKSLWQLILSGVFERFPRLRYVMTEQGVGWVKPTLDRMDGFWQQMKADGRVGELSIPVDDLLSDPPSSYFERNCWVGASFPSPSDGVAIQEIGVDRVMWGSDYPHDEGTFPLSREAIRNCFAGWNDGDLDTVLAGNAAEVYGFDLEALAPIAAQHGPTRAELHVPLDVSPAHRSPAFNRA